jgi:hypothetical protein
MGYEPAVFNQLFNFIPRYTFQKSADRLGADRYARSFRAWPQFLLLLCAQATGKQTLREITGGLQVHSSRLCHPGFNPVPRSTIADGLERRSSDLFMELLCLKSRQTAEPARWTRNPSDGIVFMTPEGACQFRRE